MLVVLKLNNALSEAVFNLHKNIPSCIESIIIQQSADDSLAKAITKMIPIFNLNSYTRLITLSARVRHMLKTLRLTMILERFSW